MSRKILFFINPISGTKGKIHLEKKIIQACGEKNMAFEILFTSKDGDYTFLPDKIDADAITDIVICGGDGSLSPIISATLKKDVAIGIIPLGSGNGLARTAGIPQSVDKALEVIFKGKTKRTDAFFVNNNLSCHVCGLGFDAMVAHEFARQKKRGLHSYTRLSLKNFFSARSYSFNMETPEETFHTDAFLICIANSNQFGNNFKIAPAASISDGLLDIVILKKTSKPRIVFSFVKQILYGKMSAASSQKRDKKNILYFQTSRIKIENLQNAPFHIDGDPTHTDRNLSIEILPSAYRLIRP